MKCLNIGTMCLEEIVVHTMSQVELAGVLDGHCSDVMKGKGTSKNVRLSKEGVVGLKYFASHHD